MVALEDAWAWTTVDFVLQAWADAVFEDGLAASSQHEVPVEDGQGGAACLSAWIGSKIVRPVFSASSDDFDARPFFAHVDAQLGHVLVVFEDDVEPGPVIFDESGFEDEGFAFGCRDDDVDASEEIAQLGDESPIVVYRKILAEASMEVFGFSDVDDMIAGVLYEVDAGIVGYFGQRGFVVEFGVRIG